MTQKNQLMCRIVTWRQKGPAFCRLFLVVPAVAMLVTCAAAADKKTDSGPKQGEAAIRATADAFVKAFNARDAKGIASLWTPNGTLADEREQIFKGRKAIEEQYAALFKEHPTARMQVAIKSIEFPTPTTAVEDGVTQVMTRDNDASGGQPIHRRARPRGRQMAHGQRPRVGHGGRRRTLRDCKSWAGLIGRWETKADDGTVQSHVSAGSPTRAFSSETFPSIATAS